MVGGGDTGGFPPRGWWWGCGWPLIAMVMANARHYLLSILPLMGKSACKALFRLCARRGQQKPTINGNLLKKDSAANRLATVMANTPHGRGRGEILPLGRVGRGAGNCPCLSFILILIDGLLVTCVCACASACARI